MVHNFPNPADGAASAGTRRANRRRLGVFLGVFVTVAAVGLAWCFMRPAQYRATSRLQITPATALAPAEGAVPPNGGAIDSAFLTEVQTLTSRPLIKQVAERLGQAGMDLSGFGADPVLALQAVLTATPAAGTHVVEMMAVGPRPELPAALLNGISDVYRERIVRDYQDSATAAITLAAEESAKLDGAVAAKRQEAEAFRVRHGIVSSERDENSVLAEVQGMAENMKGAHQRVAEAEGKLNALRAAAVEGKGVVRSRDDPTLASLEQRASQARETLREMQRQYTPAYLALDPQARNLVSRLAELDDQIKVQRGIGAGYSLTEAEEELSSARASEAQLQRQIADGRQRIGDFAAQFSQYKSLNDALKELEKTYQAAQARQARLEATERARMPMLQVLEQAAVPTEPWRPAYWRDAAIVLGASLLLALAAMALVEIFNRGESTPSVIVNQPVFTGALSHLSHPPPPGLGQAGPGALTVDALPLLARTATLPREFTADECVALLRAADHDTRCALALIWSGLTSQELFMLRWLDVDPGGAAVHIGGSAARTVALGTGAAKLLTRVSGHAVDPNRPVLPGPSNGAATPESLAAQLLCAAHDASLESVLDVTSATARHTYIAYLVRQGARFADLTRWVGPLDASLLSAYSALAPPGPRLDAGAIARDFPALDRVDSDQMME